MAVIVSGSGSNGSGGVAAIKDAGGKVMVQALSEAERTEMPENALRMVTPDLNAPAADIGRRLAEICSGTDGHQAKAATGA